MKRVYTLGTALTLVAIFGAEAVAQSNPYAPDTPEPGTVEEIAKYTTEKKYLPKSFAFNPMHRYLNHSGFRYLYNIILNWNDFPRR